MAPPGAAIHADTGLISWVPDESQGPGIYVFTVRVTDDGIPPLSDQTTFHVSVDEVNHPPVMDPIPDGVVDAGGVVEFTVTATDPDLPPNKLTFSLGTAAPAGATLDPESGEFHWHPHLVHQGQTFTIPVRVMDDGSPELWDESTFNIEVLPCAFLDDFSGWREDISSGSDLGRGSVEVANCQATLSEEDSFVVALETTFPIPDDPRAVQISFEDLIFDETSQGFVRDAFEIALVDVDGNPLLRTIVPGRDSFFNITEGIGPAVAEGVVVEGNTVTVGLNGLPPGTEATLIIRLVNNDSDVESRVTITGLEFRVSDLMAVEPIMQLRPTSASGLASAAAPINPAVDSPPSSHGPVSARAGDVLVPPQLSAPQPLTPSLLWSRSTFTFRPDSNQVTMTPLVVDLDGDGIPEVIFTTFTDTVFGSSRLLSGVLQTVRGNDGSEVWSTIHPTSHIEAGGGLTAGDITLDGGPEIIATTTDQRVVAYTYAGTLLWTSPPVPGGIGLAYPSLADLDNDGIPEIIIASTVLNHDGTIRWTGGAGKGDGSTASLGGLSIVADVTMDGNLEIVAGNTVYRADGTILWENRSVPDGYTAVANFDTDPSPEIVLVSRGSLYLLEHTGKIKWGPIALPGGLGGLPVVADMTGDGHVEIGVASTAHYVVFDKDGVMKWSVLIHETSSGITGSSVFDFHGGCRAEVVYADERYLYIFDGHNGNELFRFARISRTTLESPVVADVDGNGKANLVVIANNFIGNDARLYVFGDDDNWVETRPI